MPHGLMCTDVVQSSEIAHRVGTGIAALFKSFHDLQDEVIRNNRGDLYQRTGDGCIAIFKSAVSALNAALDLLEAVGKLEPQGDDTVPYIRIGVTLTNDVEI